jgi:GTP-binding protein
MNVKESRQPGFICSAAKRSQFPRETVNEYCLLGRSNVGKSSFINHVLNNRSLARVSKTPGKTGLANFYQVSDTIIWVDLPGYGYARKSREEKARWSRLIGDYCRYRATLTGVLWLLDIRHCPTAADNEAYDWLCRLRHPVLPVVTKADKLPRAKRRKQIQDFMRYYRLELPPVHYSIHDNDARERFWDVFSEWTGALNAGEDGCG